MFEHGNVADLQVYLRAVEAEVLERAGVSNQCLPIDLTGVA